jgi:hypothetical protein
MKYIDPNTSMVWTRSEDLTSWTNDQGQTIIGHPDMVFEQLLVVYEQIINPAPVKSDAERIAELESQLAALLSRL